MLLLLAAAACGGPQPPGPPAAGGEGPPAGGRTAVVEVRGPAGRFSIDTTEVTVSSFLACVEARVCAPPHTEWPACNGRDRGDHPVNCVDWDQSDAFCRWAGGRLPAEEEWEAAAGGGSRTYPWGEEPPQGRACVAEKGTCPSGSHPLDRSPAGALDMAGNVREWTASGEPLPSGGTARVLRGGGWEYDRLTPLPAASIAERAWIPPGEFAADLGFRCARDLAP